MKSAAIAGVLGVALAATVFVGPVGAQSVQRCSDAANCTVVSVVPAAIPASPGATITAAVELQKAADNGQPGGPDEVAALAFSLGLVRDGGGTPLTLADCSVGPDGLPAAVKPDPAISNFKVVVENLSCANGRIHCLCPDAGTAIQPDSFVNIVAYGPNPLPTPGPNPVQIPVLPDGRLLTIDLKVDAGASGTIRLHPYNQADEPQRPIYTAFLSIGDPLAVDQTCRPISGEPPCSGPQAVSQVIVNESVVTVSSAACAGDCGQDGEVTVEELVLMVNIALGNGSVSQCMPGDSNGDGSITVEEIVKAVNNALNGCPRA